MMPLKAVFCGYQTGVMILALLIGNIAQATPNKSLPGTSGLSHGCAALPDHARLREAMGEILRSGNAGIFTPSLVWISIVDRSGVVCVVAKTGDAWPASRILSVQKAVTANAFSNEKFAFSTANLYSAVQPGGMFFGLQAISPMDPQVVYRGHPDSYATVADPLVGLRPGGFNTLGGGLALYGDKNTVLGGLGVSGDTPCSDHIIAWRLRKVLGFKTPKGVSMTNDDNIIHDISGGKSNGGYGHPVCNPAAKSVAEGLPHAKTPRKGE